MLIEIDKSQDRYVTMETEEFITLSYLLSLDITLNIQF